ncbi:MCE family protein [soil metagenome]
MRVLSRLRKSLLGAQGRTIAKLAVYSAVCIGVLLYLVALIGNIDYFADTTGYEAELGDVTGLVVNDSVKIAGVEVGKVTGIDTERGNAVVKFKLDEGVELRSTSQAGVRWRNVLGQKYLYVYPGTGGEVLESGEGLPITQAVEPADVGEFLNAVGPVLAAIDPQKANAFVEAVVEGLQGNEARVRDLLGNTATVAETVGGLDTQVGQVIGNLDTVVGAVADRDEALDSVLANLADLSTSLAERNDTLQQLVTSFAEVQTELNTLIAENRGDLDASIDNLQVITDVLGEHRDDLDETLATLPDGLLPYHIISSYGQWFQVRATVACLANQTDCTKTSLTEDALDPLLAGSGGGGGEASLSLDSIPAFALSGVRR